MKRGYFLVHEAAKAVPESFMLRGKKGSWDHDNACLKN
jgi:hypothetical protein